MAPGKRQNFFEPKRTNRVQSYKKNVMYFNCSLIFFFPIELLSVFNTSALLRNYSA